MILILDRNLEQQKTTAELIGQDGFFAHPKCSRTTKWSLTISSFDGKQSPVCFEQCLAAPPNETQLKTPPNISLGTEMGRHKGSAPGGTASSRVQE